MLTRADILFVQSLQQKEARRDSGMFVAEGEKIVSEMLAAGIKPEMLIASEEWLAAYSKFTRQLGDRIKPSTRKEIERCSSLKTPQNVILVSRIPEGKNFDSLNGGFGLALDEVQDPGNVGTIIRIAAWFGVDFVLCSPGCADLYNPKVIQASMGAFYRVPVIQGHLKEMLERLMVKDFVTAAAVMDGNPLHEFSPPANLVMIMGNESRGVSSEILSITSQHLTIPSFAPSGSSIESLNVSTAASVVCYELSKKRFHGK